MKPIFRPDRPAAGFSLIEIVLALGVFSIAIVAILGLFPTALDAAQKGRQEAQATILARGVFSTLRGTPFDRAAVVVGLSGTNEAYNYLNLGTPGQQRFVLYDFTGKPLSQNPEAAINPVRGTSAIYLVTIKTDPVTTDPVTGTPLTAASGLTNVSVTVEYPAAATPTVRSQHTFQSLISK